MLPAWHPNGGVYAPAAQSRVEMELEPAVPNSSLRRWPSSRVNVSAGDVSWSMRLATASVREPSAGSVVPSGHVMLAVCARPSMVIEAPQFERRRTVLAEVLRAPPRCSEVGTQPPP